MSPTPSPFPSPKLRMYTWYTAAERHHGLLVTAAHHYTDPALQRHRIPRYPVLHRADRGRPGAADLQCPDHDQHGATCLRDQPGVPPGEDERAQPALHGERGHQEGD